MMEVVIDDDGDSGDDGNTLWSDKNKIVNPNFLCLFV